MNSQRIVRDFHSVWRVVTLSSVIQLMMVHDVHVLKCRYFSGQSSVRRRPEPDDIDSEAEEVGDDEFDAFLGKPTIHACVLVVCDKFCDSLYS